MGTIIIGRTSYEADNLEIVNNCVVLGNRIIELPKENVIQLVSVEDILISYLKTRYNIIIGGIVESVCSYGDICATGTVGGIYAENCRFKNFTGFECYKKAKSNCRRSSKYGKKSLVKLSGGFKSVSVRENSFPVEILLTGKIKKANCRDLYCKGIISSGRCSNNLYYSRFAS